MCECESDEHFVVALVVCAVCACENNIHVLAGNSVKGFNLELNLLELSPLMGVGVLCVGV